MNNDELTTWIKELDNKIDCLTSKVAELCGEKKLMPMLLRWVIFPLIVILAGKTTADYFL